MLGSPNLGLGKSPLTLQLKIDELHALIAPLDRYGLPGLSSALTDVFRALARCSKGALRENLCQVMSEEIRATGKLVASE